MDRQRLHKSHQRKKIVTGIDIGLANTGLCSISLISGRENVMPGKVFSLGFGIKNKTHWEKQKVYIQKYILGDEDKYIYGEIHKADLVVIEKPFGIQGHGKVLLNLLGIIQMLCVSLNKPHVEVSQTTLKKFATGNGHAEKSEMVLCAYKGRLGTSLIPEGFRFEAKSEDEVDAFFLSLFGHCLLSPESFSKAKQETVKKVVILN